LTPCSLSLATASTQRGTSEPVDTRVTSAKKSAQTSA
jgi:hypothetical protein